MPGGKYFIAYAIFNCISSPFIIFLLNGYFSERKIIKTFLFISGLDNALSRKFNTYDT